MGELVSELVAGADFMPVTPARTFFLSGLPPSLFCGLHCEILKRDLPSSSSLGLSSSSGSAMVKPRTWLTHEKVKTKSATAATTRIWRVRLFLASFAHIMARLLLLSFLAFAGCRLRTPRLTRDTCARSMHRSTNTWRSTDTEDLEPLTIACSTPPANTTQRTKARATLGTFGTRSNQREVWFSTEAWARLLIDKGEELRAGSHKPGVVDHSRMCGLALDSACRKLSGLRPAWGRLATLVGALVNLKSLVKISTITDIILLQ